MQSTRHLLALQNCQNHHGIILCDPKTCLRGSLRATKCLDASYSVPRRHTISVGPYHGVHRAPWVRQNRKICEFHPFGGPKKTQVKNPENPQKSKKSKFRKNEAVPSNTFAQDHMANLLRLTGELGNFGFQIDWPEIWPGQTWGGQVGWGCGGGGGGGSPSSPPPRQII